MANFYIPLLALIFQVVLADNNLTNSSNITVTDTPIDKGCDRLEYVYDGTFGDTRLKIIPAGVCYQAGIGSEMWVCDNANKMRELSWFSNNNCKGEPSYSESVKEALEWDDPRNISITCCTGNQCPYADIIIYDYDEITDCSDVDRDIGGDINSFESLLQGGPYVIDSCDYDDDTSTKYQCTNGTFIKQEYDGNLLCEGSVDDTEIISDGDCDISTCTSCSSGKKAQISNVICGVALDTCGSGSYRSSATFTYNSPFYFTFVWILFGLMMVG